MEGGLESFGMESMWARTPGRKLLEVHDESLTGREKRGRLGPHSLTRSVR